MNEIFTLYNLKTGDMGEVIDVCCESGMSRRLSDVGLVKNSTVECVGESIFGNPRAYRIFGSIIAIRNCDAKQIFIRKSVVLTNE